jgi:isocitrate/isopropylmalate dehydrogenase
MTERTYRIAVIPGDGIGTEVVPEGVRVLEAAAKRFGFELRQDWFDFSSCDYYLQHGRMMPEDWKERIGSPRRHLLRRGRLARQGAGPHLALGLGNALGFVAFAVSL